MSTVADTLRAASSTYRRIFYRPGIGNAGDALIAEGFYQLADRIGLEYTELPGAPLAVPGLTEDDLLIVAGGGWLSPHWSFGTDMIDSLTRFDAPLLMLPASAHGCEDALRKLRPQDTFFAREQYSYDAASALGLDCEVHLAPDMAFSLDPETTLSGATWQLACGREDAARWAAIARHRFVSERRSRLSAWRTDAETTGEHGSPRWRDDLSQVANFGTLDRESSAMSAGWLMRIISWYDEVETDRLHIGIAAALLGKPVRLHANAYHKIRGIYEHSLRDDSRLGPLVEFVAPALV